MPWRPCTSSGPLSWVAWHGWAGSTGSWPTLGRAWFFGSSLHYHRSCGSRIWDFQCCSNFRAGNFTCRIPWDTVWAHHIPACVGDLTRSRVNRVAPTKENKIGRHMRPVHKIWCKSTTKHTSKAWNYYNHWNQSEEFLKQCSYKPFALLVIENTLHFLQGWNLLGLRMA